MSEKYYTPEISEFRIGFECEFKNRMQGNEWAKEVCDWDTLSIALDNDEHDNDNFADVFRVKYLDREDIESLGFVYRKHKISDDFWKGDTHNNILIEVLSDKKLCIRHRIDGMLEGEIIGIAIKNKSELKVLLKQLGL